MPEVTYDRGDQTVTVPLLYTFPPNHNVPRYIQGIETRGKRRGLPVQVYNPAFTTALETREALIREQLAELGITAEPHKGEGERDTYSCGHYHLWETHHWRIALFHPVIQGYCNHVSYGSLKEALTILHDLQNQPLLPPEFESTLIWHQVGEGNTAHYQHFLTQALAEAHLKLLLKRKVVDVVGYQPLVVPYQVPYRINNSFYIEGHVVERSLVPVWTHHQFVGERTHV